MPKNNVKVSSMYAALSDTHTLVATLLVDDSWVVAHYADDKLRSETAQPNEGAARAFMENFPLYESEKNAPQEPS